MPPPMMAMRFMVSWPTLYLGAKALPTLALNATSTQHCLPQHSLRLHGLAREILHQTGQVLDVLNWRFGQDAMAQIKDVAWASGRGLQNSFSAGFQFLPIREQKCRVEIALHGTLEVEAAPGIVHGHAPIYAHDVGSRFFHGREQAGGIGTEIDDWHSRFPQGLNEFPGTRQDVTAVVFDAKAADPT